jgi:hypothetical protein
VVKRCRDKTSFSSMEKNASAAAADRPDRRLNTGLGEALAEPDRGVL